MKKNALLMSALMLFFIFPSKAHAVCPICTVAVGAGLGLSRWIGIDDTVTGVWIGGLIISSGLWLADWISKKWKIRYSKILSILIMALFVIPPLYWSKIIGNPNNKFIGIDKVLFGTIVGSLIFFLGVWVEKLLRKTNNGKVYVYYQRVIVPVFILSLVSYILYLITK